MRRNRIQRKHSTLTRWTSKVEAESRFDADMPHATWIGGKSEFRPQQFPSAPRHSARFRITRQFPNCCFSSPVRDCVQHSTTSTPPRPPTKKSKMSFQPPAQHEQFQHILRLLNTNVKGTGENLRPIAVRRKRANFEMDSGRWNGAQTTDSRLEDRRERGADSSQARPCTPSPRSVVSVAVTPTLVSRIDTRIRASKDNAGQFGGWTR